ncbi:MAG TPA: hypothetical protein VI731_11180, partial [Bacteroidia bacterium]|nr:hypothetical protein [Bacteroidia bacterium]
MTKKILPVIFFFLSLLAGAQNPVREDSLSPLQVVEKYVSPDGFPDKLKYFCCEMAREWQADSTFGQQLPKGVKRTCRLVYRDSIHAAVSVWLRDSAISRDYYFYLVKEKRWTI